MNFEKLTLEALQNSGLSIGHYSQRPKSGYMVSIAAFEVVESSDNFDSSMLSGYFNSVKSHLLIPSSFVGVWLNESNVYLDLSINIGSRAQAIAYGKKHNQIAIWDVENNCEIFLK